MSHEHLPVTLSLSLVSHTNVGKTTLARTLLGRDVGEVRDAAHVTESADAHELIASAEGDRLLLWGHSQGGHSSLWTGHLAATLAPELTLVGVSAAAPAAAA